MSKKGIDPKPYCIQKAKFCVLARDFSFSMVQHGLESETLSAFGFPIYQKVILGFKLQEMGLESFFNRKPSHLLGKSLFPI